VAAASGAIGGTAIAVVFVGGGAADTVGATFGGILIVGMPMIVAERGASFEAAATGAGAGAFAGAAAG
jgi:hypothetical protein